VVVDTPATLHHSTSPTATHFVSMAQATGKMELESKGAYVSDAGPPVPPKALPALPKDPHTQLRNRRPQPPPKDQKVLPLPPSLKPLPQLPPNRDTSPNYRTTLFWVLGFCVWFLIIVVMLPVIMERDAMPGFNRWLRKFWRSLLA
jgi:hypothetical protein